MTNRARIGLNVGIGVAFVAALAALCAPPFAFVRGNFRRGSCHTAMEQIGLGFSQYAQDYDGVLPLDSRPEGWVGALHVYLKSERIFQCPSETARGAENLTDFWFNRRLAGATNKTVISPNRTLLAGDGEASDDPNVSLQVLPPRWRTKDDSPARRHLSGAVYLFVDGHAKWLKPERIDAAQSARFAVN